MELGIRSNKNKILRLGAWVLIVILSMSISIPAKPIFAATPAYRMPFDATSKTKKSQSYANLLKTYNGYHNAEDWTGLKDNKVYACADGEVVKVTSSSTRGGGIYIKHGDFWAEYMHVVPSVKKGDKVKCGQQIAVLATKSNTPKFIFATHLHWGIRAPLSKWNTSKSWYAGSNSQYYYTTKADLDKQGYVNPSSFIEKKLAAKTVSVEAGLYSIRNDSGKYLNAANDKDGGKVNAVDMTASTKLEFTIVKNGSAYSVESKASASKRVLNVYSENKSAAGMNITLYKRTNDANQKWVFEEKDGGYVLHPSDNTSVALTLQKDGSISLATNSGVASQIWYLDVPVTVAAESAKNPEPDVEPEYDVEHVEQWPEDDDENDGGEGTIDDNDNTGVEPNDNTDGNNSNSDSAFSAMVTNVGVKLDWDASANSLGYRIYRSVSPDSEGISVTDFPIMDNEYVDVNVDESMTYYYVIREVSAEASFNPSTMELTSESLGPASEQLIVNIENLTTQPSVTKHFILMQLGSDKMRVDEQVFEIDPGRGTKPELINGRTLVPIRTIIEVMNGTVGWDDNESKISLDVNENSIAMWMNSKDINVNGATVTVDTAPEIINDRTMLPLRFVAENIGCQIEWIGSTQQIIIVFYS